MNALARRDLSRARAARGFVLSYVIYSLLLLGIVTLGMSRMRPPNDQAAQVAENVERLDRAIDTLTLGVQLCATEAPVGATVEGVITAWPVVPATDPSTLKFGSAVVSDMRCPGLTGTAQRMWTGREGIFYPQPPQGFDDWRYSIVSDCGRVESIQISIEAQSPAAQAALRRVRMRRPAQRAYDENTDRLTVTLLDDPCPS